MLWQPSGRRSQLSTSTPGVPNPRSAMSVEVTVQPCASITFDIAPSPQHGSQTRSRKQTWRSSASVTQAGVA